MDVEVEALSPEDRQQFELAGAAEAWLRHPHGYPREMRRIRLALEPDETLRGVYHIFLGKRHGRTGLAVTTGRRFIFVQRRLIRPKIISIPFEQIVGINVADEPLGVSRMQIETEHGTYSFWQGGDDRQQLRRLHKTLEADMQK